MEKVSQTLTITESTATPSDNKLAFNIAVLKTKNGLLKFFQTIFGIICMGILINSDASDIQNEEEVYHSAIAFMLCVFTCTLSTFLILTSYLMSPEAAEGLPKTIFEPLHSIVSFVFYTTTSMAFLIIYAKEHHEDPQYDRDIAVAVLGLVSSALYFMSSYFSVQYLRSL